MSHTNVQNIGSVIFRLEDIASTNDLARQFFNEGKCTHGAVVVAGHQAKGRGQANTLWESEAGKNLLLSLVLEPDFLPVEKQVYLNLAVSLSLHAFISNQTAEKVSIKWPNDIYVDDQKIAGILIENVIQQNHLKLAVVGMGINVNQSLFEDPKAVSLIQLDGRERDLTKLLNLILEQLNTYYEALKRLEFANLMELYRTHLYGLHQKTRFMKDSQEFEGEILGIDESGRLMVWVNEKKMYFHNKEIAWVK